ncbi:MAG: TIGR01777 family oxidoreductase [Phycisphaeraceae bacterium]
MSHETFTQKSRIDAPVETVFAWHERPGALERLLPPWRNIRVVERTGGIENGAKVKLRMSAAGLSTTMTVEHRDYEKNRQFRDLQIAGPMHYWQQTHRFEPADGGCAMIDEIEYEMPLGGISRALTGGAMRREIERVFRFRHKRVADDLALHARLNADRPWKVAVSGSHGFIGSALAATLTTGGHAVYRIVRGEAKGDEQIGWDPATGEVDREKLAGLDAVVHLAAEPLMGKWSEQKKRKIRDSRVEGTRQIAEAVAGTEGGPRVLIAASAVGYYGDRSEEVLDESSEPGEGFLAEVCREWEAATRPAAEAGVRVVNARFGLVMSPAGAALGAMLPVFKLGLGGKLSDGRSWWSWVSRDDVVGAICHAIATEELSGPVNVVAPEPVRNGAFAKTLGRVLRRPAVLAVPRAARKLALGELAQEGPTASQRVRPGKLEASGFVFRDPELEPALRGMLGLEARG